MKGDKTKSWGFRLWEPVDCIVAMMAVTVCLNLLITLIPEVEPQFTDSGLAVLDNIMTSFMSIITLYVGAKLQANREKQERARDAGSNPA